jgi:1-deoxy-D-xylulose-5-phosphate synthase
MVLMAPSDEAELNRCLRFALKLETPAALRYPRDNVPVQNFEATIEPNLRGEAGGEWEIGKSRVLREGSDATLIVYGALAENALTAATQLAADGIEVEVIDARFCKPLDGEMLARVLRSARPVLTVEDHSLQNGFATAVIEHAVAQRLPTENITRLGMPDRLVAHATRPEFTCRVSWKPGTLTVWDNRRTMHNAINDYQGMRRHMRRLTSGPTVPV